ncbi:uncharacterized protein LOC144437076 [Glandiceps talaboti]
MELKAVILLSVVAAAFAGPLRSDSRQCATECTERSNLRYDTGKTYRYRYTSTSSSYINGTSQERSGFQVNCDVAIEVLSKCEMSLNLDNVRIQEESPSNEMLHPDKVEYFRKALEEKPLMFSFQDGEIPEICPDMEEETWALNIKRAVLSHFQSTYFKEMKEKNVETDVTGSCPTKYDAERDYYGTVTIKKSKDFMGCRDRHHIESAIQSNIYDPRAPTISLVNSNQFCDQVVEDDRVRSVVCKENHISRPFANHTSGAVTTIRTTFELADVSRKSSSTWRLDNQVTSKKTLLFDHKSENHNTEEDETRVEDILNEICRNVESDVRPETAELFTKLVFRMRKINADSLRNIHRHIKENRICRDQQEKIEKFFMDAIPMMSTPAAVTFMKEKISSEEIEGKHADMWLLSLSFITHPTKEMIRDMRDLVSMSNPRRSTYLSLSSMINKYCETENRDCLKEDDIVTTLRLFEDNLGWKCSPRDAEEEEKIILSLKALANSGQISSATNTLTRCFEEEENSIEIRLAAIDAFRRMPCEEEGRKELVQMVENTKADTEIRIAAYLAVMKCPSVKILRRIQNVLEKEEINQVGSFIWSHLKNLNETSDPLKQDIRKMLGKTKLMKNFDKDPRKFSRAFETSMFSEKMSVGATVENHVVFAPDSWIPRSAMLNMTTQLFGYSVNLFEVGGRIEGFDYLLESFFGPGGYFPDNSLLEMVKTPEKDGRPKRSAIRASKLNNLHDRFDAEHENSPRGSMYMKMFGNEMSFMDFQNIDWLKPEKESVNFLEMLIKLSKDQTYELTKNMILMESSFETPTIMGMPLHMAVNSTASTNLQVSGKVDLRKVMVAPRSLNITGHIRPSGVVDVSTEMTVCAFIAKTGLRTVTRMHSSVAVDGSISLDSGETFKVQFNVPENRMDIMDVSHKLYLVNSEFPMELPGIRDNYREYSKCTGRIIEKWAGVRLCGDLRYPNATQHNDAPFFPLTGPMSAKITLEKVDPTLKSYNMEAKYQVQKKRVNFKTEISDVIRFMIGTPGTFMPRTHSIDVVLNRAQKALNVDVVSLDKKLFVQTKLINETDLKKAEFNLNYNNEYQYTTSAELVIDRSNELTRYMPTVEIHLPNRKDLTLSGSINHQPQRTLEVDMIFEGLGKKSHFIGKLANETNLKRAEFSVNYNDNTPYVAIAQVGIDRSWQTVRFRPTFEIRIPNKVDKTLTGVITHQKDSSLDVDMTLRGVRDNDMAVTANINGEMGRNINVDITLKGIRENDVKFSGSLSGEKWRKLDLDMSLEGIRERPIALITNIEGQKWSSLKVDTTLKGIKEQDIVFNSIMTGEMNKNFNLEMSLKGVTDKDIVFNTVMTGEMNEHFDIEMSLKGVTDKDIVLTTALSGEKWRNLNAHLTLNGVRDDEISIATTLNGKAWKKIDGSITIKGIRKRPMVLSTSMNGERWSHFDGTVTLEGVTRNNIILSTNLNGEKDKHFDGRISVAGIKREDLVLETRIDGEKMRYLRGSVTLKGVRPTDIVLSTDITGEEGRRLDGSVTLQGVRDQPIILSTKLSGKAWETFDGTVTLAGVRPNPMVLTTAINGEPWEHFDATVVLEGVRENRMRLTTRINGEAWKHFDGSVSVEGVRENPITVSTNIDGEAWKSFVGRLDIQGVRENDIILTTNINGERWSRLQGSISLEGAIERKITLETDISGEVWRNFDGSITLTGAREQEIFISTSMKGKAWRNFDGSITLRGIRENEMVLSTEIRGEAWRNFGGSITLRGIRENEIVLSTEIRGEAWRNFDGSITLQGIREKDIRLTTVISGEPWQNINTDITLKGIKEQDIVFTSRINGARWSNLHIDTSLHGAMEHHLAIKSNIVMEMRHSLEADLTLEGFHKMISFTHKLINETALKRVEFEANYNNEKRFSTNAQVAIEGTTSQTRYLPSFEVHLPNRKSVSLRGTITHEAQRSLISYFSFDRSGEESVTLSTRFTTDNNGKYNGDMTFTHPEITLEFGTTQTHTPTIMSSHIDIKYTLKNKPTESMVFVNTLLNKTAEGKHHYDFTISQELSQWEDSNYESQVVVQYEPRREGSIDLHLCLGKDRCQDENKKFTLNMNIKNETNIYIKKGSGNFAITRPASNLDFSMDASHEHTRHFLQSQMNIKYEPRKEVSMLVELRNETRTLKKVNGLVKFNIPSREVSLRHEFEEVSANNYESTTTFKWDNQKEIKLQGEYNNNSDNFRFDHNGKVIFSYPGRDIILEGNGLKDESNINGEMKFTYAPNREIAFSADYKNKSNRRKRSHEATVTFDTPFRLFRDMQMTATLEMNEKKSDAEVFIQYAPRKSFSVEGNYENKGEEGLTRHDVEMKLNMPRRQLTFFTYVQNTTAEYEMGSQLAMIPEFGDKRELNFGIGYGNYTTRSKLHHEVSLEVSTAERTFSTEFGIEKSERELSSEWLVNWHPEQQMTVTLNFNNKSQRSQTEYDASLGFVHPSREIVMNFHHENNSNHLNTRVDMTWDPYTEMIAEVLYNKRPIEDEKTRHETTITIMHPKKFIDLTYNLEKSTQEFNQELELKVDYASKLMVETTYTNRTNSRRLAHDTTLKMTCPIICEETTNFEFHLEKTELDFSLESKISRSDDEIELEITHRILDKSETRRNEFNLKLDTPLTKDHPLRGVEIDGSWERSDDSYNGDVEMKWGRKRKSQQLSVEGRYERTIRSDRMEHDVELKMKHPMELTMIPQEPEVMFQVVLSPTMKSNKITYKWDDVKETSIETIYHNYTSNVMRHHLVDIIIAHPELTQDMHLTSETKLFNGPELFNTMLSIDYSPEKEKEIYVKAKVHNSTTETEFRYKVETEMRHLSNNVDLAMNSEIGNNQQKSDGSFDMTYKKDTRYHSIKFNGELNKDEKSFNIKTELPIKTIEITGKFENRSTAGYCNYYLTLDNKYDDWKEVRSSLEINTKLRLFEVTVHHNHERPEDYVRLTAQFMNETAVEVRAHRNVNGEKITDALISTRLNTSEILYTRIHWRPEMPREVKEMTLRSIRKINETMRKEVVQSIKEKYWEMYYYAQDEGRRIKEENQHRIDQVEKLMEEIREKVMKVYHEMKPEYKEKLEEMKETIKAKYQEMRTQATEQFKGFQEKHLNNLKVNCNEKWEQVKMSSMEFYEEEIRPIIDEIKEALEDIADLAEKDFEDIKEYWTEQYEELREYWEEYAEILEEKFEHIKITTLRKYQEIKLKMEEMKNKTQAKLHEYRMRLEEVRKEAMEKMMEMWQEYRAKFMERYEEAREKFMQKYEETKAKLTKKWEETKEIATQKWEETRAKGIEVYNKARTEIMKRYNETRNQIVQKYYELREKAKKIYEDIKEKIERIINEYKEEYRPQYEEMKQRIEELRTEMMTRYEEIKSQYEEFRDDLKMRYNQKYMEIMSMEEVQELLELLKLKEVPQIVFEEAKWAWNYWEVERNAKELYNNTLRSGMEMMREMREELKNKYVVFEPENGNIFITIPLPVQMHSFTALPDMDGTYLNDMFDMDMIEMLYRFKPSTDIYNWIPPFKSHAVIAGQQHYMTFDKKFYEFAGACSYIVARDFIDDNFTVVVNYERDTQEPVKKSLTVITHGKEIEISPDFTVLFADIPVELPIQHINTTVVREGDLIKVHNTKGITVTCNLKRDVCTLEVSGWYFDKTGGLAGTYNNEPSDDFTTSDNRVTDNSEDLARSWEVGRQCRNHMNRATLCENISRTPKAEPCNKLFQDNTSPLRKCFGLIDPKPYHTMCMNDLCSAKNDVDTENIQCNAAAAYVTECQLMGVDMYMPNNCVRCKKPDGSKFFKHENIKLTSTNSDVPRSADIVVIVEEKKCNEEVSKVLPDFIRKLDSEFKAQGLEDNRYGLIGFGGEGVHSTEHTHTIDSKNFNKARKFLLGSDGLVFSETSKNNDTFSAIRKAANYPFRTGVSKSIIVLTCSQCKESESVVSYDELFNTLKEQDITVHVMTENGFKIKKSSVVVYGLDARTVFTNKDNDNPFGTKDLREFVTGPENQCTRLAQETNGTVFDANRMPEKSFSNVFSPRMVFSSKPAPCQICECVENEQGMGKSVCRPCEELSVIRPTKLEPSIVKISKSSKEKYGYSGEEEFKPVVVNKFDDWFKKPKKQ